MSLLCRSINVIALTKLLNNLNTAQTRRHIKRWVAPTLRELYHRSKKLGPQNPEPRSSYIEWNYKAELFAFGKRLNEEFQMPLLQTAFTERTYINKEQERQRKLGVEEVDLEMKDNTELAQKGGDIIKQYVEVFLRHSLPKVPVQGLQAIASYLLSTETLSHVALHLGMKELIFTTEYPPTTKTMAHALQAVIGALAESSGIERAFFFVRDFICTQLNQKDLLDLWTPEKPLQLLAEICKDRKLGEPEPRLLGDCGKNTILAAYHVGIYANKTLLGTGFGEDCSTATDTAAISALQTIFDMHDNRRPFDFQLQVKAKNVQIAG